MADHETTLTLSRPKNKFAADWFDGLGKDRRAAVLHWIETHPIPRGWLDAGWTAIDYACDHWQGNEVNL